MFKTTIICGLFIFIQSALFGYTTSVSPDSLSFNYLDSIVVNSSRAGRNTPVAHTTISQKQLNSGAASHSLPMVLGLQPSVVATTEGGL